MELSPIHMCPETSAFFECHPPALNSILDFFFTALTIIVKDLLLTHLFEI